MANDLLFLAVAVHDRRAHLVSAYWTGIVVELDIIGLRPTDDALLFLGGNRSPFGEVGHVALDRDVATAGVVRVLIANDGPQHARLAVGVLRAVDEADQVAIVHIREAVRLVDDSHRVAELPHRQPDQLVAEVAPLGADVQEHVALRRWRRARTVAQRPKGMQLLRAPAPGREALPGIRAESDDAAQLRGGVAASDTANKCRHQRANLAHAHCVRLRRPDAQGQEDSAAARRGETGYLRFSHRHTLT